MIAIQARLRISPERQVTVNSPHLAPSRKADFARAVRTMERFLDGTLTEKNVAPLDFAHGQTP